MIKIKNKQKHPVQLLVRSRKPVEGSGSRSFTTLIIPGVGKGKNIYYLEDEKYTEYIDYMHKKLRWIDVERVSNKDIQKGD